MLPSTAHGDSYLSRWQRVREFAVPPSMIETATARRRTGDWAGACAAAGVDADLDPRSAARVHGSDLAARLRADLRRLAPDLLRWHMPRIAPDGLLRPGLTLTLARYGAVHLVVRTAPGWADAGQRISLALWDPARPDAAARRHPHPRPNPRFRLDLHRHLWNAHRAGELRVRAGGRRPDGGDPAGPVPPALACAVDRWPQEAALVRDAEGLPAGPVRVRLGARRWFVAEPSGPDAVRVTPAGGRGASALPVLPDAATWVPPDVELLRTGAITSDRLHPLVAAALAPDGPPPARRADRGGGAPHVVACRGARHRIGLVDGVLTALDHDADEIRREELLAALTGTPLPCLRAVDDAHRRPECLDGVRERLGHGDTAGALAVVEALLGPAAVLRDGPLRDALEAAARGRLTHGLYRAGLVGRAPGRIRPVRQRRSAERRSHPRHATLR